MKISAFFRIAFNLLPVFGDDVEGKRKQADGQAYPDDRDGQVVEHPVAEAEYEFDYLNERIYQYCVKNASHTLNKSPQRHAADGVYPAVLSVQRQFLPAPAARFHNFALI